MEKIMKSTKLLHKILGILFWFIVVVYVVGALIMFVALVAIKDTAVFDGFPIFIGDYTLLLSKGFTRAQMGQFLWLMFAGYALFGGLYGYGIRILQEILEPMTQGKPFNTAVSDGLKKLSYAVLVFGVANVILQVATDVVYNKMIDIPSLFAAGVVESYSISISTMMGYFDFVVWFFVIRLFRRIFIYGETLQQLSDETL